MFLCFFFFFQAEDGIRDLYVTGVQTCALPISAEACVARPDHPRHRRRLRHHRDHAPIGQSEACGVAMAAAVHGVGRRRVASRQDAQARQVAAAGCDRPEGHRPRDWPAAGRSDALDWPDAGQGGGYQLAVGATHPRGPPARAASCPDVQAVERSDVRRKAQGCGRSLHRSSRPCRRTLGRREEPNPSPRPHSAGTADEAGGAGTMTHDYKRNGTTTLFAALNVLDGTIISRNMKRHRHQEFIRFLNEVDAQVPKRKEIHAIIDNYATHKHPKVRKWLSQHPRWTFHFTPTSASWLNAVEGFFAKLTNRRLKRGVFRSVADLEDAINRFVAETNADPKPFVRSTRRVWDRRWSRQRSG